MDLLQKMLERDPEKRISSYNALDHPAFGAVLSKSPLIIRKTFDPKDLVKHQHITKE